MKFDTSFFLELKAIPRSIEIEIEWFFAQDSEGLVLRSTTLNGAYVEVRPESLFMELPSGSITFASKMDMLDKMSLGQKWLKNHLLGLERGYPIEAEEME